MSDYNQQPQQPTNPPQQPNYPQQPYGQGYPATAEDPGKTLGIVGLVLSFFTALIGMIISIVAFRKSKAAGFKNTPALAGIIIGAVTTVLSVVAIIAVIAISAAAVQQIQQVCGGQPSGTEVRVGSTTVTCP